MFEHLGQKVSCSAYYKKIHDGVHIRCYDKDGRFCNEVDKAEKACAYNSKGEEKELSFEGDGVNKVLYELANKEFNGVIVGETRLLVVEYLYTDIGYHYNGEEFRYISKQMQESCECYVVYYANNRKRYVPKDCCVFLKGGES